MRKRLEIRDPSSCLNRAGDDELMFVLLGRDPAGPGTIRYWVKLRIAAGKNKPDDPQIIEALNCARLMEEEKE